jgi:hypothetical protein
MNWRSLSFAAVVVCLCAAGVDGQILGGSTEQAPQLDPVQIQISNSISSDNGINVVPFEFDPNDTNLAQSSWLSGVGCAPNGGTDPGCTMGGDLKDKRNEGLLLAKTGLTANIVAAGARINGVKGTALTELGYDLRKPLNTADARGSHCGAGAPRFNVVIGGVTFFIGCNSPTPVQVPLGAGWIRLRWGAPAPLLAFGPAGLTDITGQKVDSITIIFDEGQDIGPDNFGMAVLDNIDVNGQIAGRGPHGGK